MRANPRLTSTNESGEHCPGGRVESLPVSPARLVDMNVTVHQARHQDVVTNINNINTITITNNLNTNTNINN